MLAATILTMFRILSQHLAFALNIPSELWLLMFVNILQGGQMPSRKLLGGLRGPIRGINTPPLGNPLINHNLTPPCECLSSRPPGISPSPG